MTRAALYARVSSDLQEKEHTIESQLEALRRYARDKGYEVVAEYVDEGYSGATLQRPGLDQVRDALRSGKFEVVLFHSPDRLARKAVYQRLVLEEMEQTEIKPEFLNYPVDDTPESKMLLGMQGLFAEYERAKITERNRRGKLHWARQGALMGGYVPYGYRYVSRDRERGTRATLEINEVEAPVILDMYRWFLEERLSCRAIARRLTELGILTRRGKAHWTPSAVNRMLKQEVYKGVFYYHRAEAVEPSFRKDNGRYVKHKLTGRKVRPREEWIAIPVPPIVDEATWEAAQHQLHENFLQSPRNNKRHQYLLRGLFRCPKCGATCVGAFSHGRRNYHCNQNDPLATASGKRCGGGWVRADVVEEAVWDAITEAFQRRHVLVGQYRQRVALADIPDALEQERQQIQVALKRVNDQQDRITDAYMNEALELLEYKAKMDELRERKRGLEKQLASLEERGHRQSRERDALERLESFCEAVAQGLDNLTFEEKQQLLRLLVERILVENSKVQVEAIIPLDENIDEGARLRPQSRYSAADSNNGRDLLTQFLNEASAVLKLGYERPILNYMRLNPASEIEFKCVYAPDGTLLGQLQSRAEEVAKATHWETRAAVHHLLTGGIVSPPAVQTTSHIRAGSQYFGHSYPITLVVPDPASVAEKDVTAAFQTIRSHSTPQWNRGSRQRGRVASKAERVAMFIEQRLRRCHGMSVGGNGTNDSPRSVFVPCRQ
jgi:site-specific DNA recombinase